MSQIDNLPLLFGAGQDTVADAFNKLEDVADSHNTWFSGESAPSVKDYRRWIKPSTGQLSVYDPVAAAWVVVMDDVRTAGGGLVRKIAGAFTTLAPTSAVAASGTTELVRKNEVDARALIVPVYIGAQSASFNRMLWCGGPAITVVDVSLVMGTSTSGSDASNNWAFQLQDLTAAEALLATAKNTNGSEITADTTYDLGVDQNQATAADAVLQLQATKTGNPDDLDAELLAVLRYTLAT